MDPINVECVREIVMTMTIAKVISYAINETVMNLYLDVKVKGAISTLLERTCATIPHQVISSRILYESMRMDAAVDNHVTNAMDHVLDNDFVKILQIVYVGKLI